MLQAALVQEILEVSVIGFQLQTRKITLAIQQNALISCILQRTVEIGSVTDILVGIDAVVSVCLVECAGTFAEPRTDLTSLIKEVAEPVVLAAVIVNGFLDAAGDRDFVIQVYDFLCALDHPGQNTFACVLLEAIAIVLDVALALNLCIEGDDDQSAPSAVI